MLTKNFHSKNKFFLKISFFLYSYLSIVNFSIAQDFCCIIPDNTQKTINKNYLSYPQQNNSNASDFEKSVFDKYLQSIIDYNRLQDKISTLGQHQTKAVSLSKKNSFASIQNNIENNSTSILTWLNKLFLNYLSPKSAQASDEITQSSFSELMQRLQKKYSFEKNRLVAF